MKSDAFSPVASTYDATFSHTPLGKFLRERVWEFVGQLPLEGLRVLEINCGTGEDALWLAGKGARVLATDASPEMIRMADLKIAQRRMNDSVRTRTCDFKGLKHLDEGSFDLIFSNFGGINCIPAGEMPEIFQSLQSLLRPGGRLIFVVMGRFCWWETLYFLLKGRPASAFRRFSGGPITARLSENHAVSTWYYTPRKIRDLTPWAVVERLHAIGWWLPPSYLDPFFLPRPAWLNRLNALEKRLNGSIWAGSADHFYVQLQRKN